jgi:hypothetical protein
MNLVKLAVWSRKIHRFLVLIASIDTLILIVTGFKLHESLEGNVVFPFIKTSDARWIHGQLTIVSIVILGGMLLTGVYLYIFPWLNKITRKKTV